MRTQINFIRLLEAEQKQAHEDIDEQFEAAKQRLLNGAPAPVAPLPPRESPVTLKNAIALRQKLSDKRGGSRMRDGLNGAQLDSVHFALWNPDGPDPRLTEMELSVLREVFPKTGEPLRNVEIAKKTGWREDMISRATREGLKKLGVYVRVRPRRKH